MANEKRKRSSSWAENFDLRQQRRAMLPDWVKWIHLVIMLLSLPASVIGNFWLIIALHNHFHPGIAFIHASPTAQELMGIPLITAMPGPAFVVGNFLEWAIVPIRRVWEKTFEGVPGASLKDAMQVTAWLMAVWAISMAVAVVGAIDPWSH
jgi:hypothetical protein